MSQGLARSTLTHLERLEAESIHIIREVVAEAENPVMLYSVGKDSAVMLHLARKAFYPRRRPSRCCMWTRRGNSAPCTNCATRWPNCRAWSCWSIKPGGQGARDQPVRPWRSPHRHVEDRGLKQALDKYGFDAAFGGARRDEEKSRAKERIFRSAPSHGWDPKNQRPELWNLYNAKKAKGESIRVFPISNWTELDVWQYIHLNNIPIVPLYFAEERPTVERDGMLLMVDDDRFPARGRSAGDAFDPLPHLGLLSADGCGRKQRQDPARGHSGNLADHHQRAAGARHRQGCGRRRHGSQKAAGVFLR
jgi:sulfate adenylyltransferase subunit 2